MDTKTSEKAENADATPPPSEASSGSRRPPTPTYDPLQGNPLAVVRGQKWSKYEGSRIILARLRRQYGRLANINALLAPAAISSVTRSKDTCKAGVTKLNGSYFPFYQLTPKTETYRLFVCNICNDAIILPPLEHHMRAHHSSSFVSSDVNSITDASLQQDESKSGVFTRVRNIPRSTAVNRSIVTRSAFTTRSLALEFIGSFGRSYRSAAPRSYVSMRSCTSIRSQSLALTSTRSAARIGRLSAAPRSYVSVRSSTSPSTVSTVLRFRAVSPSKAASLSETVTPPTTTASLEKAPRKRIPRGITRSPVLTRSRTLALRCTKSSAKASKSLESASGPRVIYLPLKKEKVLLKNWTTVAVRTVPPPVRSMIVAFTHFNKTIRKPSAAPRSDVPSTRICSPVSQSRAAAISSRPETVTQPTPTESAPTGPTSSNVSEPSSTSPSTVSTVLRFRTVSPSKAASLSETVTPPTTTASLEKAPRKRIPRGITRSPVLTRSRTLALRCTKSSAQASKSLARRLIYLPLKKEKVLLKNWTTVAVRTVPPPVRSMIVAFTDFNKNPLNSFKGQNTMSSCSLPPPLSGRVEKPSYYLDVISKAQTARDATEKLLTPRNAMIQPRVRPLLCPDSPSSSSSSGSQWSVAAMIARTPSPTNILSLL